jgi:hypothetical protein
MTFATDLAQLFAILDAYRNLPAYKLEPRADPFFALFLPPVLSSHLGVELHPTIIPEFPLRRGTLWGENTEAASASVKVDYIAFSKDCSQGYLVELKTDAASRRDKQDDYLKDAQRVGLRALINGVLQICLDTSSHSLPKYVHLLHELEKLGLVAIPDAVYEHVFPEPRRGAKAALGTVRNLVSIDAAPLEIIYIQPGSDEHHRYITFDEFASRVADQGEVGRVFAAYLRKWVVKAGAGDPRGAAIGAGRD